jgi:threonine/homoserine/homoserine lactone efflux protein
MFEDYEKRKKKQVSLMRSVMDYGMGILILALGIFFFFRNKFDVPFNEKFPPNEIDKIFGAVCMLYGGWRIYRGYKKKYFK